MRARLCHAQEVAVFREHALAHLVALFSLPRAARSLPLLLLRLLAVPSLLIVPCSRLGSRESGLTDAEVAESRRKFGPNSTPSAPKPGIFSKIWQQVNNILIYILIGVRSPLPQYAVPASLMCMHGDTQACVRACT
ncbi:hypothetical protein EON62_01805, partial [archaeon]